MSRSPWLILRHQRRAVMSCDWSSLRYDVAPQRCVDILGWRCKGTKKNCNNKIFFDKNVVTIKKRSFFHDLLVNPSIFRLCIEARAIFFLVIITMAVYMTVVHQCQFRDQLQHSCTLGRCSCVSRFALLVKPSDITDANTVCVVSLAMSSRLANRPPTLDGTIQIYNVVVPDVTPAISHWGLSGMPGLNVCSMIIASPWRGRAVEDDIVYVPGHRGKGVLFLEILVP